MSRLKPERLIEITGYEQPKAQARWFARHFGVTLPTDRRGPIITDNAWEEMVKQKAGLIVAKAVDGRPAVRPIVKKVA